MLRLRLPIPRFFGAGEILHGKGSLSALRTLDGVDVAVVASRSVLRHHRSEIERAVNHLKLSVLEYPGGEPNLTSVAAVAEGMSQAQPNWIIAIGGGSVLDGAKLAWILYEHPETDFEALSRPFALRQLRGRSRFVAVPTTAGTGSEVSSAAVITGDEDGRKRAIVSHELIPDIAILDPKLTVNVPRAALIAAGMDALAHSVESYVSKFSNPMADIQAEKSVEIILRLLPQTVDDPEDMEARLEMMVAALMAGWVQNLKVPGIGHALAHQLGLFGIAHGMACGGLLQASVSINLRDEIVARRYARLASSLSVSGVEGLNAVISELKAKLEFSSSLANLSSTRELSPAQTRLVFEGAHADICARANPVAVTDDLLAEMLERSW
ncbi:MAG: Aldehyde-alcohol dehydrogenase [Verrucomicrobia subdivision 3 bacterium]|nr:Aldehyde-alcohol dehydrogenase [Limisphaerales bacterium]MCS1415822.1 Aldehyde-alcohol dehydrogenase [Limisphaerales bacterium]